MVDYLSGNSTSSISKVKKAYKLFSKQNYEQLKQSLIRTQSRFRDPVFPASMESLCLTERCSEYFRKVKWLRPSEITYSPHLYIEGTNSCDIVQGILKNCWFVAACSALYQEKQLWHKVVPHYKQQDWLENKAELHPGIFCFRFYIFGRWMEVVIDDLLPTLNGNLIYARSPHKNEFWGPLLEKAYAKLSGCYEYLEGGNLTDALVDFTGGISQSIFVKNYPPRSYPALFRNLQRYMDKHALMCCAIDNENAKREEVYHNGLVNGHAYSIIDFRRVHLNQPDQGTSTKMNLIRLRNPWGGQEWNGAFSNKSPEWKNIPSYEREKMHTSFEENGEFWMPFLDFCKNFTDISICHMPNSTWYSYDTMWYEASIRGRWTSGTDHSKYDRSGGCVNNKKSFLQNPQYCLDISSNNEEIIIYLMQRDLRLDTKVKAPYIAIGMFITQVEENRVYRLHKLIRKPYSSEYIKTRGVFMKCLINKGRYLLIPTTFEPGQLQEFFLRVYSNKDVNLRELIYDHPKKNRWNVFALNQEVVITSFTLLSVANLNPAFLDNNGLRIFCLVKCEKFKFFTAPIIYSELMVWDVSYIMYHQHLESPIVISVWEQKIGEKDSPLGHTQIKLDQSSSNTLVYTKAILEYNGEKKIGTLKIEVRRSNNLFEL